MVESTLRDHQPTSEGHPMFWHLLRGVTVRDFRWLLNYDDLLNRIFTFDMATRSACTPYLGEFPWYVILLLGGRSKKFIFSNGSFCSTNDYVSAVVSSVNKLAWRCHFSSTSDQPCTDRDQRQSSVKQQQWWKTRTPTRFTEGPQHLSPFVAAKLTDLRDILLNTVLDVINKNKTKTGQYSNFGNAFKEAFAWLKSERRNRGYKAIPSDKDGGFVLIHGVCKDLNLQLMDSGHHFAVRVGSPLSRSVSQRSAFSAAFGQITGDRSASSTSWPASTGRARTAAR